MLLCVFTEPQMGAAYDDLLKLAHRAEECGFHGFFSSDHYMTMGGSGLPGPTDAWITLAGLARDTSRIRLGTLVTAATFRLPGPLAIAVAQVDQMSGGRAELGLGAGWYEAEHRAYGIPFPPRRERFDRLAEQLGIVTGLWGTPAGSTFTFSGAHYTVEESPGLPKPVQQPGPPVIVGGLGLRRTPALAARYATEYNVPFAGLSDTAVRFDSARAACAAAGRAPLALSVVQTVCCGRTDAELRRRAEATGRDVATARERGLAGTPAEIVERLAKYAQIGTQRVFLQILDLSDLNHLEVIAADVAPHVRSI